MSIEQVLDLLRCPLCTSGFTQVGRSVRCVNGHSFDLARQGYLNLLGRAAPAHADTPEMVRARDQILAAGHFDPLSRALRQAVRESHRSSEHPLQILEVGAGTGHYLAELLGELGGRGVAVDISTAASRRAAQVVAQLGAVVADGWQPLPLADAAFDVVLSVFAPRNPAEFARVLRPEGLLLVATPLAEHLVELRDRLGLLQIQADKSDRLAASLGAAFDPRGRAEVRYRLDLDAGAVADLVGMGPNAFHRRPNAVTEQLQAMSWPQPVTFAMVVSAWAPR
jgi:23S rRNA (guanine745-N1)-methyltransferase